MKTKKLTDNVSIVFLFYWVVLVAWQNINPEAIGTMTDTLVKFVLLGIMVLYFATHRCENLRGIVFFGIFILNMLISFIPEDSFAVRSLLNYFFPVLFVFLTIILGGKHEINKSQLKVFLNGVVAVSLYTALYTVIFMQSDIIKALNAGNAYGNELSSFFVSNHEYALYMMAGIVSAIILIEINKSKNVLLNLWYAICIALFMFNLILTFSRTYLFATIAIIGIYAFINRKSKLSKLLIFAAIAIGVLIITVPSLSKYVYEIILKSNTDAGRNELTELAWKTFDDGSIFEKLWGHGISSMQDFFESKTTHASIHNAYLQILLYFGGIGLFVLLAFVASHIFSAIKIIKKEKFLGAIYTALVVGALLAMVAQTVVVFTSSIDSFFLTVFAIIVPKYVINSINAGAFENDK